MREYLAVATRPAEKNVLGLKLADAPANARALRERTGLLAEDSRVGDRLLAMLDDIAYGGRQILDTNVVSTMEVHGIHTQS